MKQEKKVPKGVYDTIIIGGGPAGLTAGLYSARSRLNTLLVESFSIMSQAGMTETIENYPGIDKISGIELLNNLKKQAESHGLKCKIGTVRHIFSGEKKGFPVWRVEDESGTFESLSLIVASGAVPKNIGVPGEKEFVGKGVSYCAICDAAFFRDKDIVVVGGGNTAAEEAMFLSKFAKKITLIHRRDRLRADRIIQERVLSNKKMKFIWDSVVEEIAGSTKVEKVRIKNVKTGKKAELACDGVFIFAGWSPNTDFVKDILKVNDKNCIIVDSEMRTSREGIFACGDCCHKKLHQVVTACGDGAVASNSAREYVDELKGVAYK
ncbi:MAG: thioredoxin-disulfide reductase [Candidatus Omnitrophota bacterium]